MTNSSLDMIYKSIKNKIIKFSSKNNTVSCLTLCIIDTQFTY